MIERVIAERDELRLEICAMRGHDAGRISPRWTWRAGGWELDAGTAPKCAARVDVAVFRMWLHGRLDTEPVDSIRDGMRQCEKRITLEAS